MVTEEDLEELRQAIANFEALRNKRGSTSSGAQVNTKRVKELISEITALLRDQLDHQVNKIKRKESLFADRYFAARNILDLGSRQRVEEQPLPEAPAV